jgi:two-component system, NtrC family, response regulator AtoC
LIGLSPDPFMKDASSTARKISLPATSDLFIELTTGASAVDPRRHALLVFCDDEAQLKLLAEDANVVVGREAPSEIVVNDGSVSRQHARFVLRNGVVSVEDLDSRNGTFVRGKRIERSDLSAGDEIRIGRARVVLAVTRDVERRPVAFEPDAAHVVSNDRMKALHRDASSAARANMPVLILGETGVGKELVATAIHREGPRRDKPFVVVNCGAIPAGLVESTLFGHERGAFTGATSRATGVFEKANGGVLFLDEVGELGLNAQAALLRAIDTGRIQRVGGSSETAVNVRVVAATHCDLEGMVIERTFRKDLFFRLSGVVLEVPPLRERRDEIEPLARLFLHKARAEWGARASSVAPDAIALLGSCSWPGNVRQLRHAIERAALLAPGETIRPEHLPDSVLQSQMSQQHVPLEPPIVDLSLREQLERYERRLIEEALRRAAGSRQIAARLLRIPLRTLFRRMNTCGVTDPPRSEE